MPDRGTPPIEFVDAPGTPPTEAEPPDRRRRPLRWTGAAATALVVAGWALLRPHAGPAATHPAPASPARPGPVASPAIQIPPGFGHCPRYAMCTQSLAVPAFVAAAVHRQFPRAAVERMTTVEARRSGATEPVLLRRRVDVAAADWQLRVVVSVHTGADRADFLGDGIAAAAWSYEHVDAEAAGFALDLEWLGRPGTPPPDQRLRHLAEDPALVLVN